jgi:hypothetical protein
MLAFAIDQVITFRRPFVAARLLINGGSFTGGEAGCRG